MKNDDKSATSSLLILATLLIIGIIGIYLWQTNQSKLNNPSESEANITGEPLAVTKVFTLNSSKILLFLDKNGNGVKDDKEEGCDVCVAKPVLAAKVQNNILPEANSIKQVTVVGAGNLATSGLENSTMLWGAYEDRKALIPNVDLTRLAQVELLYVPVWEVSSSIGAINAYIQSADFKGQQAIYTFSQIIPSMQNSLEENLDIWLQFFPNQEDTNVYYLAKSKLSLDTDGKITGMQNSYYLVVEWNFPQANAKVLKRENLRLFFLN